MVKFHFNERVIHFTATILLLFYLCRNKIYAFCTDLSTHLMFFRLYNNMWQTSITFYLPI